MLLLLLLCIGRAASADSIRRFEVFIDTDPGVGAGTIYLVPLANQADTVLRSLSFSIPGNITPGRHTLYVRSYADTAGAYGRWSAVQARTFWVPEKIVAAERFFDNDPGVGAGTPITVSTQSDTVIFAASVSTTGLSSGWHVLYTRTKSNTARWSAAQGPRFFVEEAITAGEYFFDTDPGVGGGNAFSVTTPDDTITKTLSIATPSSMADGKHILYVRTKSGGKWSAAQGRDFFVLPSINAAEYFFDNDPGVGNGIALSVSPVSDTVNANYNIATTGLAGGPHRLYVRSRSVSGRWSIAQERSFYVRPKIVAAEYFWDTDPGVGGGIALALSTQSDTVTQSYSIKAPCLSPGTHYLYVRTKDEFGHWGIARQDTATFSNPSVVATATYPGPGPYGTPVKVLGSGGIAPYTYKMGSGSASLDSLFLAANGAAAIIFTAIDTCGCSGTTTIATPAKPTIIAGGSGGSGSVLLSGYRFWAYVQDGSGKIIGAVRDNRRNLGTVTMNYLKNNSGTVRSYPVNNIKYLDRNWYVASGNAPGGAVGMQLFAVDSEFNALDAADPFINSKNDLRVNKYNGPNEDLSVSNNSGGSYQLLTPDSVVSFAGQTTAGNGYALAFSVSSFSEFYESRNTAVALALQSVDLKAAKVGNAIQLSWHTEGEQNTASHILGRGRSNGTFETLTTQRPASGKANDYRFMDESPLTGANYYRVTVQGANGEQYFSQIVLVRMSDARMLTLSPNPAHDALHVNGLESGDGISLHDMAGHTVWQRAAKGSGMSINTAPFAAGIYMLHVDAADGLRTVQRLEIVH